LNRSAGLPAVWRQVNGKTQSGSPMEDEMIKLEEELARFKPSI
jgi:hypothetical protein